MLLQKEVGFILTLLLCGCTSLSANTPSFKNLIFGSGQASTERTYDTKWWEDLGDPTINILVDRTFATNPTLEKALAQIDEAKAQLGVSKSEYYPKVGVTAGLTKNYNGSVDSGKKSVTASIGPSLSWEIDLFGRIRNSNDAAKSRLSARSADAQSARIMLASNVATTVLDYRACQSYSLALESDVASRKESLNLLHKKVQVGFSARTEEDSAKRDLALAAITLTLRNELCENNINALVALSGADRPTIQELTKRPRLGDIALSIPAPPHFPVNIEAIALRNYPSVRTAEYEAEAAWADINVAKAERLPKLDLLALLTGQWVRAAGSTVDFTTWALGATVSGVLFDGGRGAANVDASEARYRKAVAVLQGALRTAVQEAQDALAAQQSANERYEDAMTAVQAGQSSLTANEALWKNGSTSLLELEDSRRQLSTAQIEHITAKRDRTAAWIALHRVLGVPTQSQDNTDEKN
ncbi:MAG: OprM [Methylotenera sp.]|nr:MAG: OprM [Methylotenera sp.]